MSCKMKNSATVQQLDFCSGHFSEVVKLTLLSLRFKMSQWEKQTSQYTNSGTTSTDVIVEK